VASMRGERRGFLRAMLGLFGTAFLRYRFPLNLWAVVPVGVNAASAAFLGTAESRAVRAEASFLKEAQFAIISLGTQESEAFFPPYARPEPA
jgi:hypothetical protein